MSNSTVERCVNNILAMSSEDLLSMHNNTLKAYKEKFLSLDLEGILSEVLD